MYLDEGAVVPLGDIKTWVFQLRRHESMATDKYAIPQRGDNFSER